jgi:hypothetical protein
MEKLAEVEDFISELEATPFGDVITETVRMIKYDSRNIYVLDFDTNQPIAGA